MLKGSVGREGASALPRSPGGGRNACGDGIVTCPDRVCKKDTLLRPGIWTIPAVFVAGPEGSDALQP